MTRSNLRFNVCRSFVALATNLPSCFFIQFLRQLLKFLLNFALRSYDFLITKEQIFWLLDFFHFSASLINSNYYKVIKNIFKEVKALVVACYGLSNN